MPTIIRRSPAMGDTRLARRPFEEPGVQPRSRLSSLNFQGAHNQSAANLLDAGTSPALFTHGTGVPPVYQVGSSDGVPAYRFNQPIGGDLSDSLTVRRDNIGATVRTMLCVAKFYELPSSALAGSGSYAWLMRSATGGSYGFGVASLNNATEANRGRVIAVDGPNATTIVGPVMPLDGKWHFFALSYLFANNNYRARFYFDDMQWEETSTTDFATGAMFLAGGDAGGGKYAIAEACAYSTAFTDAEIADKRKHYRALFQF